jgi:2-polyprenyl-3-methyl-5-hydroxy-6-metoxy-1,4-benzoquinol methylase
VEPTLPFPNRVLKHLSADDTAWATVWDNRSRPEQGGFFVLIFSNSVLKYGMRFLKSDQKLWDELSVTYSSSLLQSAKTDSWYHQQLIPRLIELLPSKGRILDFGCGDGYLAHVLTELDYSVTGIDVSQKMIELAKKKYPDVHFHQLNLDSPILSNHLKPNFFEAIIANMVLHDIKKLDRIMRNLTKTLKKNGVLLASIPHPCFYNQSGKNFFERKSVEMNVTTYRTPHVFTKFTEMTKDGARHYHRPLHVYFNLFLQNGYVLSGFDEIFATGNSQTEIPMALLLAFRKK